MSLKNLFKNSGDVVSKKSLSDLTSTYNLESYGVISSSYSKYNLLPPNVDFSEPSSFAKYGSAEHYYDASIKKICNTYPYDGSKKEKLQWRNNASYLDLYLYNNEYPKYTGSIDIGYNFGTVTNLGSGLYNTSITEYIFIPKGLGLNTKYNENNDRTSCFSFDKESGFCIEFWYKKNGDIAGGISSIIHAKNDKNNYEPNHFEFLVYNSDDDVVVALYNESNLSGHVLDNKVQIGEWNHFSINIYSATQPKIDIWLNGSKQLSENIVYGVYPQNTVDVSFSGTIGATLSSSIGVGLGYQKISASFDDFRFWRRKRTDAEIIKNWFTTVDGGFDSDELLNPDMGFYYKFNEKYYGTASLDSIVLDYSGRKNNGKWIGYLYGNRNSDSPIENEKGDVIMNFSSSDVYSFYSDKILKGAEYDRSNNGCIINNLPDILKKDNLHYINLTQIISSIFDSLFLEIQSLSNIKDNSAFVSGSMPSDVLLRLLNSNGLNLNGVLDNYSLSEIIESKNDEFSFTSDIEKIKQVIYKNIYNSLTDIYKTKGTEKSIKSIFRSFGVDDDVLKIKSYTKEGEIEIDGNKRLDTVRRKNLINLYGNTDEQNMNGSLYLQYCDDISDCINYLSNSFFPEVSSNNINSEKTFEANILFPVKYPLSHKNHIFLNQNSLSASLFGFVQIKDDISYNSTDSTWATNPNKLNIYCVQKDRYSKDAKFVLEFTGTNYNQYFTQTDWIENVYDNTKWTFAVKIGSSNKYSDEYETGGIYTTSMSFIGINEEGGRIINSFSSTFDLNYSGPTSNNNLLSCKIKPYIGALRTNFSGSLLYPSYAKFYSFRVWRANLEEEDIINHSYDVHNFGINKLYENSYSLKDSIQVKNYNEFIPKNELLLINWDFEGENYIPNNNGIFTVSSFRSSSYYSTENTLYKNIKYNYPAVGVGFNSGSIVLEKNYAIEQKNRIPTDYYSYDDISLVDDQEKFFGKRIKPVEYFYTIENSIYSIISEDILNIFSSISDFNNLFGMTHEKYRIEYKLLRLFKKLFFSKIKNKKIDIQKYFSYYKWLDSAIETVVKNLFPLSANADSNIRNVIESHVLERPKHYFIPEIIKHKPKINLIFNVKSNINMIRMNSLPIQSVNRNQELHYLQFPGVSEYMYMQNGMSGYTPSTGKYAVVCKFYDRPTANAVSWPTLFMLNDTNGNVYPKNVSEWSQIAGGSPGVHRHIGFTTTGAVQISRQSTASFINDRNLHMICRDLQTQTGTIRILGYTGPTIYWQPADVSSLVDSAPSDIAIGARVMPNLSPTTGTGEPAYSNLKWISTVVFKDYIPTNQELLNYMDPNCKDARLIWPTQISNYWTATGLLGNGSGPILPVTGTSNATLIGLDENDLVEI